MSPNELTPATPAEKLIYVVEDDLAVARLISGVLAEYQFRHESFRTGQAFLQRLRQQTPDLCIVDLGLPDMDGMALLRQIRERHRCGMQRFLSTRFASAVDQQSVAGHDLARSIDLAAPIFAILVLRSIALPSAYGMLL